MGTVGGGGVVSSGPVLTPACRTAGEGRTPSQEFKEKQKPGAQTACMFRFLMPHGINQGWDKQHITVLISAKNFNDLFSLFPELAWPLVG